MSVIIRLQNLPWTANALDIRRFFSGLSIPDGGVHIVGGDKGDAFIAFSTDEDARRAMLMDNGRLAANTIKLLLSSKSEMQNVIAVARGMPSSTPSGPPPTSQNQQAFNAPMPQQGPSGPTMNQRFGPQSGQQGYSNQGPPYGGQGMGPPQGGPSNMNVGPPDQRQGMPPQYGSQPSQGMPPPQMNQGRPSDRPMWDGPPPNNHGGMPIDYGRRDMPPPVEMDRGRDGPPQGMGPQGGYDRNIPPRDVGPPNQGYHDNGMGPMNGSQQIMDRPPQGPPPHEYRENPRDYRDGYDYRDRSPGRDRNRYDEDRSYDRRDGRKRGYGGRSPFVFVSHMPQNINYKDVRKFFTGYEIPRDGLKLINDRKGRRVGDAFVKFSSPETAEDALKLDGWPMGDTVVRVEIASPEEFERAIDSYIPANSPEHEIRNDDRGGYERGGNMNYHRSEPNYERNIPQRHEPPMKRKRSRSPSEVQKGDSCCVVVKNLPFKIEKRDLFKLFTGLRFAKGDTSVHIEVGPDGRPKGIALIEFLSDKDVHRALSYHRKASLGGRPIEVISIPVEEYHSRAAKYMKEDNKESGVAKERSLSRKREDLKSPNEKSVKEPSKIDGKKGDVKSPEENGDKSKELNAKELKKKDDTDTKKNLKKDIPPSEEKRFYCVELKGLPFQSKNETLREFFKELQIAQRGIHIVYKPDGSAAGPAFVEFITSEDCKKALKKDKAYIGKRYIDVKPITKKTMLEELTQYQSKFNRSSHHPQSGGGGESSVAQKVGKPGCVVGVQNMHFSSTLEDILDFFRGFHPIANSVKMRYNQDGMPTGDAMVAFHNREDASRAARDLNRGKMHNRIISVYLV